MLRRVGLLFVLLAVMAGMISTVQATPRIGGPKSTSESGVLDRLWNWLAHLFPNGPASQGGVKSTWDAEGSHWDPNGNH